MNTYTQEPCGPNSDPAEQPKEPGGKCDPHPQGEPPKEYDPTKCEPDPECCCPTAPTPSPTCFDKLIEEQSRTNVGGRQLPRPSRQSWNLY